MPATTAATTQSTTRVALALRVSLLGFVVNKKPETEAVHAHRYLANTSSAML